MNTPRSIDIKEFAIRVERLCDFLLGKIYQETGKTGSDEQIVLENLKETAADIQTQSAPINQTLSGLKDFMGGLPESSKEP